jgi:hypothetical protein
MASLARSHTKRLLDDGGLCDLLESGRDDAMSESEKVLPFRRKMPPIVWSDGRIQKECDEMVHLFASVPGRCQCGDRTWEIDPATIVPWEDTPGVIIGQWES